MSIGEEVALASFALTVISGVAGAAWWMSSLYALVRTIRDDLHNFVNTNERQHDEIWAALDTKADKT